MKFCGTIKIGQSQIAHNNSKKLLCNVFDSMRWLTPRDRRTPAELEVSFLIHWLHKHTHNIYYEWGNIFLKGNQREILNKSCILLWKSFALMRWEQTYPRGTPRTRICPRFCGILSAGPSNFIGSHRDICIAKVRSLFAPEVNAVCTKDIIEHTKVLLFHH